MTRMKFLLAAICVMTNAPTEENVGFWSRFLSWQAEMGADLEPNTEGWLNSDVRLDNDLDGIGSSSEVFTEGSQVAQTVGCVTSLYANVVSSDDDIPSQASVHTDKRTTETSERSSNSTYSRVHEDSAYNGIHEDSTYSRVHEGSAYNDIHEGSAYSNVYDCNGLTPNKCVDQADTGHSSDDESTSLHDTVQILFSQTEEKHADDQTTAVISTVDTQPSDHIPSNISGISDVSSNLDDTTLTAKTNNTHLNYIIPTILICALFAGVLYKIKYKSMKKGLQLQPKQTH